MVGGVVSLFQEGKFGHGFVSAGIASAFKPMLNDIGGKNSAKAVIAEGNLEKLGMYKAHRVTAAAIIGGTASVVSGGKFANGAVTGAFNQLYNGENANVTKAIKRALYLAASQSSGYRNNDYLKGNSYEFEDFVQYVLSACSDDNCIQFDDNLYVSNYRGTKSLATNKGNYPKGLLDGSAFEGDTCGTCPIKNAMYGVVDSAFEANGQNNRISGYHRLSQRIDAPILILSSDRALFQYDYKSGDLIKLLEKYEF